MIYTTRLGDTVSVRFDDDGNEHVTVEVRERVSPSLELVPEPSPLEAALRRNDRRYK